MNRVVFQSRYRVIQGAILVLIAAVAGCGINLVALPDPAFPDLTGPISFCNLTADGSGLTVIIANIGDETAPASTTRVTFTSLPTGDFVVDLATPTIGPGDQVELGPIVFDDFPSNCYQSDCLFTVTADVEDVVEESVEDNTADGLCLG